LKTSGFIDYVCKTLYFFRKAKDFINIQESYIKLVQPS
jgi:hypothetical protein